MSLENLSDGELRELLEQMQLDGLVVESEKGWSLTELGRAQVGELLRADPSARDFAARVMAAKLLRDAKEEP